MTQPPKLVPFPAAPDAAEIPADLMGQVQTMHTFAAVHNVLLDGTYPYRKFQMVHEAAEFLKAAHQAAIAAAASHPDAKLIPELKQHLEGATDGQA